MGNSGKNELTEHPLNLVFSDRNKGSIITKFGLMKLLVQSVILRGNGFALIERANDGTVIGLRYLENNDVVRVTGYLVKKSEIEKLNKRQQSLNNVTVFGKGAQDGGHALDRRVQKQDDIRTR